MSIFGVRFKFYDILIKANVRNMVAFTQKINGITGQAEWDTVEDDYDYHQEISRAAFADMLHDTERNRKYHLALRAAIEKMHSLGKPANVLDIGTGTGLLSIMAARCGADSVIACEAFEPMGTCAIKIIEKNGFSDKIKVISKRSTDLTVGECGDLKQRQNILVTEVFDTELIGEGAIETFLHAHSTLLEKDCIVVPDSATIFAQVVECASLQRWNKIMDVANDDGDIVVRTPKAIRECSGCAAVHDIQLSQLSKTSFRSLTKPIPVLSFDWSGKTTLKKTNTTHNILKPIASGSAQMVFMWWDLKMDTEGDIILSCAPWWNHPDTDFNHQFPQDTIPWRDHWMQAVYYFPKEISFNQPDDLILHSTHDEYSLWFNIEKNVQTLKEIPPRPICTCGIHMSYSRTHVAYMNDSLKNKKILRALESCISNETVCLCLNGASLMGIAIAKMGAKKVIYIESGIIARKILDEYIDFNSLSESISVLEDLESLKNLKCNDISLIVSDPHFNSALLPWDNLRHGYYITKLKSILNNDIKVFPAACSVWVMSVEFLDLNKIKTELGVCENIDLSIFDDLIKSSMKKSDDKIEPQPLWEYPCICKSKPVKIADIDFNNLEDTTKVSKGFEKCEINGTYNGFVYWLTWDLNGDPKNVINTGPTATPQLNERVSWDPHVRQAVDIMDRNKTQLTEQNINYYFSYNLHCGTVNIDVSIS